jgi:hypothetical protein
MLNKYVFPLSLFILCSTLWAQNLEINPERPDEYIVQTGDTLWDISATFLVEPWRWPEIWRVNPEIENPHLIYPGDLIRFFYDGDTPVLTVERRLPDDSTATSTGGRNVKMSPEIRVSSRREAIHTIPIDAIREFHARPLVVTDEQMNDWPYILSSHEQHLVLGTDVDIYVRGLDENNPANDYSIYRKGSELVSMSSGKREVLGYEALFIGEVQVTDFGDPSTVVMIDAASEAREGDRLLPHTEKDLFTNFMPNSPETDINASIIYARDVLSEIGQYQVVVLDKGASDGIDVGNVFEVFEPGKIVRDSIGENRKSFEDSALIDYLGKMPRRGDPVQLPDVRAGVIMVFRTFDRVSYALVMEALRPIHINDDARSL